MKRDNLKFIGVAAVCISLCSIPVADAAITHVKDADKVDGKSAVGYKASPRHRAGKLVATAKGSGRLPNNIIVKAPNSNRLDGKDSTYFLPKTGTAANANRLQGLDASAFLPVAGKAADSDKLDGMDSSQFLSTGVLTGGLSSVPAGNLTTIFTNPATSPTLALDCNSLTSSLKVSWPTGTTGLSQIFSNSLLSGLTSLSGITSQLLSLTGSNALTNVAWQDPSGLWQVTVGYVYNASTSSCSVLTRTIHTP